MNKLIPIVVALFLVLGISVDAIGQRKKQNEQLYLMSTELLKSEKRQQYLDSRMAMNAVLLETGFPHPFIIWSSGESRFHVWHPVEELNELDLIYRAWDAFDELHGTDLLAPVEECIESSMAQVMTAYLDLSYQPDELAFSENESSFCRMSQFYLKKGSKQEVLDLAQQMIRLYESRKSTSDIYFGEGIIGFERPVLLCWSFAHDRQDYLERESQIKEELGEDYQEILREISEHSRKIETIDFQYIDGLSFNIN